MSRITDEHYRRFFDLSVDMLCLANEKGYFVDINQAFSTVLGYPKDVLLATSFLDLVHPEDLEKTRIEMEKLVGGGITNQFINRFRHANGHYLTFSWNAQSDPRDGLFYAIARDISAELTQTQRLQHIENSLISETILVTTDRKGVITQVNDKFCEISGYSREELVGQTHRIVNANYHPKEFFQELWRTIAAGKIWSGVIKNRKKNGQYYVQTIIVPMLDHLGQITEYLAIRQDITDSIKNQSELARTLEILNETSSIARVGGWELDVETGELTWTDETFRILEVEKRSGLKPMLPEGLKLFTPEHQPVIEEAVNRAIQFGEPYSLELQAQTAKGNVLWVYTNGKASYRNGRVYALSGTIQDIDARKIAKMSYDLERQKSFQSAKMASLGELAASMAHEINNPLGIISGYTELLLQKDDLPTDMESMLAVIQKSCVRIAHIVSSLRKFSRTDETRPHQPLSFGAVVREAISMAQPRLKNLAVDLSFNEESEARITGNDIEIEQVILNLINNSIDAIKDLPDRWIRLSVSRKANQIVFTIDDSGNGIAHENWGKLFTPFFTTKRPGEGTGLGLSIVEGILTDHGAQIHYIPEAPNTRFEIQFLDCLDNADGC